ncbi:hypothetical protein LSTR_LSTR002746 [Laodelphax striatellus]|uniref:SKICH domain-containing protein n=1 Tax=Laodelphax striatellus TaxID=195883 RepID=A0A482X5Q6_LAOST|nr:hypothetical protein LSTR_LSTR002746 [Laodelphax striatellus]
MELPTSNEELINLCDDSKQCDADINLKEDNDLVKVAFVDVDDMYPTDCDLRFRYFFKTPFVHPNPGDRIVIFKVGWKHVTEYYLFKMVRVPAEEHLLACQRICFSAPVLPKNVKDLYQLCYLTHDNLVLGASSPFSFYNATPQELVCVEDKACQEVMIYKSRLSVLHDRVGRMEDEKELSDLKTYAYCSRLKQVEQELASSRKEIQAISSWSASTQQELDKQKQANVELEEKYKLVNEEHGMCQDKLVDLEKQMAIKNEKLAVLEEELFKKVEEKKKLDSEVDSLTATCIETENLLKELGQYNENLKKELDTTKLEMASSLENRQLQTEKENDLLKENSGLEKENTKLVDILTNLEWLQNGLHSDKAPLLDKCCMETSTASASEVALNAKGIQGLIDDSMLNKQLVESLQEEIKSQEAERVKLTRRIEVLESQRDIEKEGLIELVSDLRSALLEVPGLEEQWKLLLESARVLGSRNFKSVIDGMTLGDQCPSTEARNLVDSLCITAQCYDSLLVDHRIKSAELEKLTDNYRKLESYNNELKKRVVELEETSKELNSCFSAIKKTNHDSEAVSLRRELSQATKKAVEMERELKEMKSARALSAIGQVTITPVAQNRCTQCVSNSLAESDVKASQQLQEQVEKLQGFLKKSAVEYAKLYQKFVKEEQIKLEMVDVIKSLESSCLNQKQSSSMKPDV